MGISAKEVALWCMQEPIAIRTAPALKHGHKFGDRGYDVGRTQSVAENSQ